MSSMFFLTPSKDKHKCKFMFTHQCLAEHLTISEPQSSLIVNFYSVQKRESANFEALIR